MDISRNKVVGKVWLPERGGPHWMHVVIADSQDEIGGNIAQCEYDFDATGDCVGALVFVEGLTSRRVLVHEATHASLSYSSVLMQQPGVVKMSEMDQQAYLDECIPTLNENIYAQLEDLLRGKLS